MNEARRIQALEDMWDLDDGNEQEVGNDDGISLGSLRADPCDFSYQIPF